MAFQEQYDRAHRWFERFRSIHHGRIHTMASDNYVDEVYAFFQNCYHLKDWIKNDPALSAGIRASVETFINGSLPLSICADLCNSQKHFNLTQRPRSGAVPLAGPRHFNLALGSVEPSLSMRLEVTSGSTVYDAFDLAASCMENWGEFFSGAGLPSLPIDRAAPHQPTAACNNPTALSVNVGQVGVSLGKPSLIRRMVNAIKCVVARRARNASTSVPTAL